MKTLLMVVLASIKRVGDLQAFSVDKLCLEFGFTLFRTRKWTCKRCPWRRHA